MNTLKTLFNQVKQNLENKMHVVSTMSQSDILRRYLDIPKSSDGFPRNESTFYKEIWPMMDELRKKDRSLQTFDRVQFGKEIPVWQLK